MEKEKNKNQKLDSLEKISKSLNADIILFNGDVEEKEMSCFFKITKKPTRENVLFILCTYGGDPNIAFKIAKRLQTKYKKFYLFVGGYCKSAGTLISIGADEIIMTETGEFGPLDIQLPEKDELFKYTSALNISETLSALKEETLQLFKETVFKLSVVMKLSTKISTEIASKITSAFITQAVSQIDLVRIGEIQRAGTIGLSYGKRLMDKRKNNISKEKLVRLVTSYPDHSFVIDYDEAVDIFENIRKPTKEEEDIENYYSELITNPRERGFEISKLYPPEEDHGQTERQENLGRTRKTERDKGTAAEEAVERLFAQ